MAERLYRYVGPEHVRKAAVSEPAGTAITSHAQLVAWLAANPTAVSDAATFVVGSDGVLRLAPRWSEHVACASGGDVRAAGEIAFARGGREVAWCSNQSSGYCPEPDSVRALNASLPREVRAIERYTDECLWRRCPSCGQTNLVKDGVFACAVCDAELPAEWNYER